MMSNNTLQSLKTSRYGFCDLLRFIFSMLIMATHLYQIGFAGAPFLAARIYVEFFFMIFMIMSFENRNSEVARSQAAKEAFGYTFRKYKNLMIYVIPSILLIYILNIGSSLLSSGSVRETGKLLFDLPLELAMIGPLTPAHLLVPIWYISALLIAMPLVCFLYLRFRSAFIYIISWFVPLVYFILQGGVTPASAGIYAIARGYCDLSIGCFLYFVARYISRIEIKKSWRFLLTVVEMFCFGVTIPLTALNLESRYNFMMLLLIVGIVIMMSGCSYSIKIKGKFFSYLGRLSLPIYTVHWCVGTFIGVVYSALNTRGTYIPLSVRLVAYYSLTIITAIIFCLVVDAIKRKNKKKFELK